MRAQQRDGSDVERSGALRSAPVVSIAACRCGSSHEPDDAADDAPDPAGLPWWDARSRPEQRRAVLPLVLLGELQAGVLLRALWTVLQSPPGPAI